MYLSRPPFISVSPGASIRSPPLLFLALYIRRFIFLGKETSCRDLKVITPPAPRRGWGGHSPVSLLFMSLNGAARYQLRGHICISAVTVAPSADPVIQTCFITAGRRKPPTSDRMGNDGRLQVALTDWKREEQTDGLGLDERRSADPVLITQSLYASCAN